MTLKVLLFLKSNQLIIISIFIIFLILILNLKVIFKIILSFLSKYELIINTEMDGTVNLIINLKKTYEDLGKWDLSNKIDYYYILYYGLHNIIRKDYYSTIICILKAESEQKKEIHCNLAVPLNVSRENIHICFRNFITQITQSMDSYNINFIRSIKFQSLESSFKILKKF